MNTKIVYVLVSQETDFYYEMLLLSLYSLRLHHPKDTVEVVMDKDTHQRLVDKKAAMLSDVTPIVVPIPPEYNVMQRSRYLKTQLRQLVEGDFLFIDTDTLICGSLLDIDKVEADVAMAEEIMTPGAENSWIEKCSIAGNTRLHDIPYFNSGVVFARDNLTAQCLFDGWFSQWKISVNNGVVMDQPSLWQANADMGFPIRTLPIVWNCRMFNDTTASNIRKSKIFHYCPAGRTGLLRDTLFRHVKEYGVDAAVCNVAREPRTIGYSVFTMSDNRALNYIYSEMLHTYDITPPISKLFLMQARWLTRPVQIVSRVIRWLSSLLGVNS